MSLNKKNEKGKKKKRRKKLTCCQRCRRRIRKWILRRIKRCCKKTIFGVPDPKLSDYEIGGINLADAKDKLARKTSKSMKDTPTNKKSSIVTLYKSKKKSTVSVPFKDALLKEYEDISLIKPKYSKIKSLMNDLKERNLYVGLSKDSKLKLTSSKKEEFRKKANEYEKKYKRDSYLKKFENKYNKDSLLDLRLLGYMDKNDLKKKFSITSSEHGVLKTIFTDYKKNKLSLTGLLSKSKIDIDKFDKKDLQKILQVYKEKENKKKSYTFVKQSKIKQFKSDLRARLAKM